MTEAWIERGRTWGALSAGLFLALAHPEPGWAFLGWLAPGLLLVSCLGCRPGTAFRRGWMAGAVYFLVSLRWLLRIPFPSGAVAGWLALSSYCALYLGVWAVLIAYGARGQAGPGMGGGPGETWIERARFALGAACAWVALEMLRARVLGGFAWNFVGVTQYREVALIQMAAWLGVYGVSFLVVWVSSSVGLALRAEAIRAFAGAAGEGGRRGPRLGAGLGEARVPIFAVLVVMALGMFRLSRTPSPGRSLRVAMVQPSIPQTLIWDGGASQERFEQVYRLSEAAVATGPDVLVWPEGSLPGIGREAFGRMLALIERGGCWWIFGGDDDEQGPASTNVYNAAFLFDPGGRMAASYRKRHLVPFGEFIPFERSLPIMRRLTPVSVSFSSGDRVGRFEVGRGGVVVSPMICFEDTFPHHSREPAGEGVDVLLELTNDGWFGEGSAQWQHAANTLFRAVENGVPLIRVANNGVSCWIDERGRLREVLRSEAGSVHAPGVMTVEVEIPAPGARAGTWYHRNGDVFGWGCVAYALAGVAGNVVSRRRQRAPVDFGTGGDTDGPGSGIQGDRTP